MRFCRLSLRQEGVLGIDRLVVSLFRRCITFRIECKLSRRLTLAEAGSRYFLNVANEETCFALCACAFKIPVSSFVWNALLTKKLSVLSRLNEINGGNRKGQQTELSIT